MQAFVESFADDPQIKNKSLFTEWANLLRSLPIQIEAPLQMHEST
jgi:hypothetical protein